MKIAQACRESAICGLWKNLLELFYSKLHGKKLCDYVLSAKIIFSNPACDIVHSVKTTVYDQNNNIKWFFHIFKAQKIQSPAKQFKELFSLVCYFSAPN